jgi:uncharacterized protein (UPF0216 family)
MFVSDVFVWSLVFFFGFIILTTFLNKVAELIRHKLPSKTRVLEERLANTNPLTPKVQKYKTLNKKTIQDLDALVDMACDVDGSDRIDAALRRKEILIRLLAVTMKEIDEYSKHGKILPSQRPSLKKLLAEEKVLNVVLKFTKKEQEILAKQSSVFKESE